MKRFYYFLLFLMLILLPQPVFSQQNGNDTFFSQSLRFNDLFSSEKGIGLKHSFDFGEARFVSCRQSIDNRSIILIALYVSLNQGWRLKKPVIDSSFSKQWREEKIFYPFSQTDDYSDVVFFPIIYHLTDSHQPLFVEKEIALTACNDDTCQTQIKTYSLSLPAREGYPTSFCPAMLDSLGSSPHKLPDNVIISARFDHNQIQIIADFPKNIKLFNIYFKNKLSYQLQKKHIKGKRAEMIISLQQETKSYTVLPLIIVSSFGTFETDLPVREIPFVTEENTYDFSFIFFSGFLFLFFSAFYLVFWSLRPHNTKQLTDQIRLIIYHAFLFPFLIALCLYIDIPIGQFLIRPEILVMQGILLIILLIRPYISLYFLPFFLIGMPYLFLGDYFLSVSPFQLKVFGIALWWSCCAAAPFYLTRKALTLFQSLSTARYPVCLLIRFPLIISLGWLFLIFTVPNFSVPFSQSALTKALQEDKTVFVAVENGPCLTCRLNFITLRFIEFSRSFFNQEKLILMSVSQNSKAGQKLLKKYGFKPTASFYLLYGPTGKSGIRIPNKYLQPEEWENYFNQVGLKQIPVRYSISD